MDDMEKPQVSVLMCVYNESRHDLIMAIESVLRQSFHDYEFIIILDNPDNKDLLKLLQSYSLLDSRVRLYVNEQNIGLIHSLNRGLQYAQGEYIARMDADDISSRNRLLLQSEYLDEHRDVALVVGNYVFIDQQGDMIRRNVKYSRINGKIDKAMKFSNVIAHPCVMFRKQVVLSCGGYREIYSAEDYDLWLRMLISGYKIWIIDKCLLKYRLRENSISNGNRMIQRFTVKALRKMLKSGKLISEKNVAEYLKKRVSEKSERRYIRSVNCFERSWEEIRMHMWMKATKDMLLAWLYHYDSFLQLLELLSFGRIAKNQ